MRDSHPPSAAGSPDALAAGPRRAALPEEPDAARPSRLSGVPVRTIAINLALIALVFLTRDRWAA
ncbi:MAG: hypothetical protein ACYSU0_13010, partial [Planctomycetota bacterium]